MLSHLTFWLMMSSLDTLGLLAGTVLEGAEAEGVLAIVSLVQFRSQGQTEKGAFLVCSISRCVCDAQGWAGRKRTVALASPTRLNSTLHWPPVRSSRS